ncbi:YL1 nuclear protein C-terminal domain-containing protein [Phlyctochytrium arcticum]|nr:YL1 nuclear protein C-terminal domain-containing protein [Phlyctochytrium arcticum]
MAKSTKSTSSKAKNSPIPSAKRPKLDDSAVDSPHSSPPSTPGAARPSVPDYSSINVNAFPKPFKNPRFATPKTFKKLKQIATAEKGLDVPVNVPTYWNIEAPPSFIPQKKYCDITGLEAPYTDPKTRLRYHNSDVYQFIRTLQPPHIQSYLELRNAAVNLR